MFRKLAIATAVAAAVFAGTANAGPVTEAELDATATNNTLGTAQAIPSSAFTTPVPGTVFDPPGYPTASISGRGGAGSGDVDFYSFVATGGNVFFDIDNDPFTFDTIVSLFNSAGTLLAYVDDSFPEDAGTINPLDAFLGVYALPGAGTYFVTVSQFSNFPNAIDGCSTTPLVRPDGEFGGDSCTGTAVGDSSFPVSGVQGDQAYTLHVSLQNPGAAAAPEPGSLALLGLALAGFGVSRRLVKKA